MNLALGIDTGGTYTDAVLVDQDTAKILASAKALTTRYDLAIGIAGAIRAVFADSVGLTSEQVVLVSLSTTLATNTLAEDQRGSVCLILVGYDANLMRQYGFDRELATEDVVYVRGGHDLLGDEVAPLDEAAVRDAILARRETVEAFAVSGYFSVRNPSHELRVRELVEELSHLPVTSGHELTSRLNAVRRATTAALNAHLILPLRELIASVETTLEQFGIHAPLMVVKGDGSLMRAELAKRLPIETILSGPAASVVGAWHLAGRRDVWVVDVGGTTTDIGALEEGWPILNADGARVGGWRTMIEAVDIHTTGLGGDSQVQVDRDGAIRVGPRRVVPLCLLASQYPSVVRDLRVQASIVRDGPQDDLGQYLVLGRNPGARVTAEDHLLLDKLADAPHSQVALAGFGRAPGLLRRHIARLVDQGLARRSAFTPTDALHVLGRFNRWETEAALLGARLMAARANLPVEEFCERVVESVADQIALELLGKVLEGEVGPVDWDGDSAAAALIRHAFAGANGSGLGVKFCLQRPIIAIGAPVKAYLPAVAKRLNADLVIPDHAEVANALGAVAGGVLQRVNALISPLVEQEAFRLHLPDGIHDFSDLEKAVAFADLTFRPLVEARARDAGAEQVEVRVQRVDHWTPPLHDGDTRLYLGTDLLYVAVGRPSPARPAAGAHPTA